jgi:glycosyltransferase involved in cell wall biosynthesis
MRILFALSGLHRFDRGAEVAFISLAEQLVKLGESVTLIGSGKNRESAPYTFKQVESIARENFESFPSIPFLRNECAYEEATFAPGLLRSYRPADYDVTLTCGYPFVNWILRRPTISGSGPPHVFVTQNGDWPAYTNKSEYRFFGCDGLVCTNPDFYERNKHRWLSALIPNGVDIDRFTQGSAQRSEFNLPADRFTVLMVSALIPSKRVEAGIEAVSKIPDAHLVVAGDGPARREINALAAKLLPDRFTCVSVPSQRMPSLYRSADVFLHLSQEESFGNVFLEAMASGLPIVGYNSPRLRWIVGENEYLVDSDDEIITKIQQARNSSAANKEDRIQRATTFAWKEVGKMYQEFLGRVIRDSRSRLKNSSSSGYLGPAG